MLEKERAFLKDNMADLVGKYNGMAIVIAGDQVVGAYPTEAIAFLDALKDRNPGEFMVQFITSDLNKKAP